MPDPAPTARAASSSSSGLLTARTLEEFHHLGALEAQNHVSPLPTPPSPHSPTERQQEDWVVYKRSLTGTGRPPRKSARKYFAALVDSFDLFAVHCRHACAQWFWVRLLGRCIVCHARMKPVWRMPYGERGRACAALHRWYKD
jgi:hypothetical protein